jgi:hypothetical protein
MRNVALAIVVAAFLAVGCGGTIIDLSKTQDQIAAEVEQKRGKKVSSVDCPSDVKVEPKAKFTCTVRFADRSTATATLLIRDEDADLNFLTLQPNK